MTICLYRQVAWPYAHAPPKAFPAATPYTIINSPLQLLLLFMCARKNCRIITTKEAQQIIDRSLRHVRRLLDEVKDHFNKKPHQPVTVKEFCEYFNFNIDDVFEILGWS